MSQDEDHIIARLSDVELLYWYERFGTERLSRQQVEQVGRLLDQAKQEISPPPRRLSPEEWAAVHRIDSPAAERDEKKVG